MAQGLEGSESGGLGAFILNPDQPTPVKLAGEGSEIPLRKGPLLRIVTPGGGGYGDPRERGLGKFAADRRASKVSS